MLVIEGSDASGKTTFAKKIVRYVMDHDDYPCMYSWMTRPNEATFDFFESYKMWINPYTVQDRFHLGALAYHKNKLSQEHADKIEEWINDVGGMIMILYAENEPHYRKLIEADTRGNLLDIPILCKANSVFKEIATHTHNQICPVSARDISFCNYMSDFDVERVANRWMQRRRYHIERLWSNICGEIKGGESYNN